MFRSEKQAENHRIVTGNRPSHARNIYQADS
jgi:hypothetical protein